MAKITVPRAQVTELLGLAPDVDDETLNRKMAEVLARQKASEGEARLQDEDKRIVRAAINDGRVSGQRAEFWMDALRRDRAANRAVIASLASGLRPGERVVADPDVERVHDRIMARLGIPTGKPAESARTAAASHYVPPSGGPPTATDGLGVPIPGVPAPVRLVHGKDPATWTRQEHRDAFHWKLGQAFRVGLKPPPGGAGFYQPSPNDVSWYDEATGEWRSKDGWERGTHGIGI